MFYLLHNLLRDSLLELDAYRYIRVLRYVTFRTIFASLTAFALVAYMGPIFIRLLRKRGVFGVGHTSDPAFLVRSRRGKERTPSMGGLLILCAVLVAVGLWADLTNYFVLVGVLVLVWLGALGLADDWVKLTRPGSNGLRARTKLIFQVGLGLLVGLFLWRYLSLVEPGAVLGGAGRARSLVLPFYGRLIPLGLFTFVLLAAGTITASSNAVNLTDGLDGLAIGTVLMAALALTGFTYVAGHRGFADYLHLPWVPRGAEATVLGGAVVGACMGFLWWNCHPAEIFMGDTGALALGGSLGYLAVVARSEMFLAVIGGVFVMEAGSVLIQVLSYKWRGKRVFACAPYHHHLQSRGWHENQITIRFWILSALFAALGVALLKLR